MGNAQIELAPHLQRTEELLYDQLWGYVQRRQWGDAGQIISMMERLSLV